MRFSKKWDCWIMGWGPVGLKNLHDELLENQEISFVFSEECKAMLRAFSGTSAARDLVAQEDTTLPGIKTTPWVHQYRAVQMAKGLPGFMLALDMGTGKSLCALALIAHHSQGRSGERILIACPKSVIEVWPGELDKHMTTEERSRYLVTPLSQRTVAAKVVAADRAEDLAFQKGMIAIHVINYDAAWRPEFARWLHGKKILGVVNDECLPAGQVISTPNGEVKIEDLCIGDTVYGVDHSTGQIVTTRVTNVFKRKTSDNLWSVGKAMMTSNHPVFCQYGYVRADELPKDAMALELEREGEILRMVWTPTRCRADCERQEKEILQQVVFCKVESEDIPRVEGQVQNARTQGAQPQKHERDAREAGCPRETKKTPEWGHQPIQGVRSGFQGKDQRNTGSKGMGDPVRWEWSRANGCTVGCIPCPGTRMEDGACHTSAGDTQHVGDRHRPHRKENCCRGGWAEPRLCRCEGEGFAEDAISFVNRMDGCQDTEQNGPGELGGRSVDVHNIETGTGNYFAGGLLVHNCHRIKSHNGRASRFMGELAGQAEFRLGLTGTPLPHSPLDIFGQYRFLDKSVFGTIWGDFKSRYAVLGGFENKVVVAFKNERDLNQRIEAISYRVKKGDVLTLPPVMHVQRPVELCASAKAIYKAMQRDLYAMVGEGEVTAANALVKVLRLLQITSGVVELDDGTKQVIDDSKIKGFADLVLDLPPAEPLVIFSRFTRDIDMIRVALAEQGRTCAVLDGRMNQLREWQQGEFNDIAVQIRAGGAGVDLTRAAYCCYYTPTHSLGDHEQSLARLDRPGQTRPVSYYYLISKGTIDEKVYAALQAKKEVVEFILEGIKNEVRR